MALDRFSKRRQKQRHKQFEKNQSVQCRSNAGRHQVSGCFDFLLLVPRLLCRVAEWCDETFQARLQLNMAACL